MIKKRVEVVLTQEEVDSPEPIQIILSVKVGNEEEAVDYTITYPKE